MVRWLVGFGSFDLWVYTLQPFILELIRYVDTVSFCSSHWCKFGAVSLNVTCEIKCKCFELSLGLYLFHSCFRCPYFVVVSASAFLLAGK